jgi:tRNA(fMet)-specific endonuclease VapC
MEAASRVMLDTNIASYVIRAGNSVLLARLRAFPLSLVTVSAITEAELLYGLARRPEAASLKLAVESFLHHVDVAPWDSAAAAAYGVLRARLEARGTPLGNLDTLIAAHSLATNSLLITNDKALRRTPELRTEDWTAA